MCGNDFSLKLPLFSVFVSTVLYWFVHTWFQVSCKSYIFDLYSSRCYVKREIDFFIFTVEKSNYLNNQNFIKKNIYKLYNINKRKNFKQNVHLTPTAKVIHSVDKSCLAVLENTYQQCTQMMAMLERRRAKVLIQRRPLWSYWSLAVNSNNLQLWTGGKEGEQTQNSCTFLFFLIFYFHIFSSV